MLIKTVLTTKDLSNQQFHTGVGCDAGDMVAACVT
jgi:hypothetical protein